MYGVTPYFNWVFGAFYNAILTGSFLVNIPFYFAGLDNVLVQEFSIKLPLIISAGITAYGLSKIISSLIPGRRFSLTPGIIFLVFPLIIFFVPVFGNPLIITLMLLTLSLVFFLKSKPGLSSIFVAAAAATYLYPIFFILPFLKIINKKFGAKEAKKSILLIIFTLFIGQGVPLIVYYIMHIPFTAGSILAPLYIVSSSITFTSTHLATWSPYLLIYSIFGYRTSNFMIEVIFILSMSIPMMLFSIKKLKDNYFTVFIEFLFIDSLLFAIFAITADPQYLQAAIPFAIILFYLKRRPFYLNFLIIASLLNIFIFYLVNTRVLILFQNTLNDWYIYPVAFPPDALTLVLALYMFSLLALFCLHFRQILYEKANVSKNTLKNWKRTHMGPNAYSRYGALFFTFAIVFILFLSVPALNNVPNVMYYTPGSDMGNSYGINFQVNNNTTTYIFNAPLPWSISNTWTRTHSSFTLYIPGTLAASNSTYQISFNSHFIRDINSSSAQAISINASYIKQKNYLTIGGLYKPDGTLNLAVSLPLQVPPEEILSNNLAYFSLGFIFAIIDISALIFILHQLLKKE